MDPCLNVALEDQAVGRVHRMGQTREVHVYRLAMKGSVDERVLDVGGQRRSIAGHMKQDKVGIRINTPNSHKNYLRHKYILIRP